MSRRTGVMVSTALLLALSGFASAEAAPDCSASHIVQQGDTVGAIAKHCGLTIEALIAANPDLKNPARISIGQELILPVAAPAEAASTDGDATPEGDAEGAAEGEEPSSSDAPTGDDGADADRVESGEIEADALPAEDGASSDAATAHDDAAATEGESVGGAVDTSDESAGGGEGISSSDAPAGDGKAEPVEEEGAESAAEPLPAEEGASSETAIEHRDAATTEENPVDGATEASGGSASGEEGEAPSVLVETGDSAPESSSDDPADDDDRAAPSEPEAADSDASPAAETEGAAEEPRLYTVQPGDSLARIAKRLGFKLEDLMAANEGVKPKTLQPGQKLVLPAAPGDAPATRSLSALTGVDATGSAAEETEAKQAAEAALPPVALEGRIRRGVECPVLRTDDGATYSLVSQDYGFTPGDYVSIEGETVEMSFCNKGQTIRVTSMRVESAAQPR